VNRYHSQVRFGGRFNQFELMDSPKRSYRDVAITGFLCQRMQPIRYNCARREIPAEIITATVLACAVPPRGWLDFEHHAAYFAATALLRWLRPSLSS
jgi:hypothetical protein